MKLVFVSNYLNHHQIPLCKAFLELCDKFVFIATDTQNIQGYQNIAKADYVIEYSTENSTNVNRIIEDADVVIFGSCPNHLIANRMRKNKLSFLYSERFYKKGIWQSLNPISHNRLMQRIGQYRKSNMYVLCASAYLSLDLYYLRFPTEKCYQWGYFPEFIEVSPYVFNNKTPNSIVWVGRLLDWKHPEMVIMAAKHLKNKGYNFIINLIGDGPMMPEIKKKVIDNQLEQNVFVIGSCSHDEVRRYMEQSELFLFTSDRMEGWGAVLNEAMGSACTPICSHLIGAVPFLIANGHNGMVFQQGNQDMLNHQIEAMLNNGETRERYSKNAYNRIKSIWNANTAARRFINLSHSIMNGLIPEQYEDGPCSSAPIIKERWTKI